MELKQEQRNNLVRLDCVSKYVEEVGVEGYSAIDWVMQTLCEYPEVVCLHRTQD
jgi:hypothetical protein